MVTLGQNGTPLCGRSITLHPGVAMPFEPDAMNRDDDDDATFADADDGLGPVRYGEDGTVFSQSPGQSPRGESTTITTTSTNTATDTKSTDAASNLGGDDDDAPTATIDRIDDAYRNNDDLGAWTIWPISLRPRSVKVAHNLPSIFFEIIAILLFKSRSPS